MRGLRWTAALFVCIALGLVGGSVEYHLPISCVGCGSEDGAKSNGVFHTGVENIGPLGSSPQQDGSFFTSLFGLICRDAQWLYLILPSIGGNGEFADINFKHRFGEVGVFRDPFFKIMNVTPASDLRPRAAEVLQDRPNTKELGFLSIFIESDELIGANVGNNGAQLLSRVPLSVVGYSPLLINEKQTYSVSYEQKGGEPANDLSPFDHLAIKVFGVFFLLLGCAFAWWCICHDIPLINAPAWPYTALGLSLAAIAIWLGLSLLV